MGDELTSYALRLRRLSKFKINASASDLSNSTAVKPATSTGQSSSLANEEGEQRGNGISESRQAQNWRKSRSMLRAYIQSSTSLRKSQGYSSDDDDDRQKGFTELARDVKNRLSRTGTGSSASQSPSSRGSSTQLSSPSSSKLWLDTQPLDPVESRVIIEGIKEKVYMDTLAAQNHVPSPVDGDMHVDSVLAPIRRKSLYTPGIATRTPDDILRKPPRPTPQAHVDQEYYSSPNLSDSSPLALLASLPNEECGRMTPVDLNYSHLGGFKAGTLRVTNGAVSPTSQRRSISLNRLSRSNSVDELRAARTSEKSMSLEHNQASLNENIVQCLSRSDSSDRPSRRTDDNPVGSEHHIEEIDTGASEGSNPMSAVRNKSSHSLVEIYSARPDRAPVLAQNYMQDLPESPFFCVETATFTNPKAEQIPDAARVGRVSFEDEGIMMFKPYRSATELWRSCISDAETGHINNMKQGAVQILSGYAAFNPDNVTHSECKPDSGYSSNDSVKSSIGAETVNDDAVDMDCGNVYGSRSEESDRNVDLRNALQSSPQSPEASTFSPISRDSLTKAQTFPAANTTIITNQPRDSSRRSRSRIRKLRKRRSSQHVPADQIIVQGNHELSQTCVPPVPLKIALKYDERMRNFPLLEHTYPSPQHITSDENMLDEDLIIVPIRFPSPASLLERVDSTDKHDTEKSLKRLSQKKKQRSKSLSPRRGSFRPQRLSTQIEPPATITDFGTVIELLGDSPYDVARTATDNSQKMLQDAAVSYHEPDVVSRACTMVETCEKLACESVPVQSNERRCSLSTPDEQSQEATDERSSELDQPIRRSWNVPIDAPPIPALQFQRQVQQLQPISSQPRQSLYKRHGEDRRVCDKLQRSSTSPSHVPLIGSYRATHFEPIDRERPQLSETRYEKLLDRYRPRMPNRPHTMFLDAPPIPSLPTKEQLEWREAQIVRSSSATSKSLAPSLQTQPTDDQPNINDAGSQKLENATESSKGWEHQRHVWAQRRKSAGDALVSWSQSEEATNQPRWSDVRPRSTIQEQRISYSPSSCHNVATHSEQMINDHDNCPEVSQTTTTATSPSRPPPDPPSPSLIPRDSASPVANPTRNTHLADRFAGGLSFGYEPGLGLGGSAGLRSSGTLASRKSVRVSRGYGLDLSDVPILATPVSSV